MSDLTAARLRELLTYCPEIGEFRWNVNRKKVRAGDVAGCLHHRGYRIIRVDGRSYWAHRLAWLYVTGEKPPPQIDHKDGNPANNAWGNLRAATPSENRANARTNSNSASGLKGTTYFKRHNRWGAYVKKDGKKIWLGSYGTAEEAHAAYCRAAVEVHGDFARTA